MVVKSAGHYRQSRRFYMNEEILDLVDMMELQRLGEILEREVGENIENYSEVIS